MDLRDRIVLALKDRLERTPARTVILRSLRWTCSRLFPYRPPFQPIAPERLRSPFRLETRPSTVAGAGLGLFALEPIPAGARVGEYAGDVIGSAWRWLRLRDSAYSAQLPTPGWFVDAKGHPEMLMRYINHHFEPARRNVKLTNEGAGKVIVATRDVAAGEELFYDYGDLYWRLRGIDPDRLRSAQCPEGPPADAPGRGETSRPTARRADLSR